MSTRPPGYYTSWLNVVTEIPSFYGKLDLYQWLGDWTFANYGHRWNNQSKKLNAILTINGLNNATEIDINKRINNDDRDLSKVTLGLSDVEPAIFISNQFNPWDRITIINNGNIRGAYAYRKYEGNNIDFTPPSTIQSARGNVSRLQVSSVALVARAAGGNGGFSSRSGSGAGGGGGGSGGTSSANASVTPGVAVTRSGGSVGTNSAWVQSGVNKVLASPGGNGGNACCGRQKGYCKTFGITDFKTDFAYVLFGGWNPTCSPDNIAHVPDSPGGGGGGGFDLVSGGKTGVDGKPGTAAPRQWYASAGCGSVGTGFGGDGGVGGGGNGGKGESVQMCNPGYGRTNGSAGSHYFAYWQLQLFGPAIINQHNNVRIINNGEIAGGYSDGKTIYAVYGANIMDSAETDWNGTSNTGTIYPTSPGLEP